MLLVGSDAGADREGIRPDTMIVASIDTKTGDTVLFSLPRNLQRVPFPPGSPAAADYPQGFYCINPANGVNTDCLLNGIWTFAENHAGDYYKGVKNPGLTATMQAAEQVTGLRINNYVMIDLKGFQEFVDAIGGVTIDVKQRLPIGGNVENPGATIGWIEPGVAEAGRLPRPLVRALALVHERLRPDAPAALRHRRASLSRPIRSRWRRTFPRSCAARSATSRRTSR